MAVPPRKYREQIIEVTALQFDGTNQQQLIDWSEGKVAVAPGGGLQLEVRPGMFVPVNVTDWVLTDPWAHSDAMPDSNFQITYAPGPVA